MPATLADRWQYVRARRWVYTVLTADRTAREPPGRGAMQYRIDVLDALFVVSIFALIAILVVVVR